MKPSSFFHAIVVSLALVLTAVGCIRRQGPAAPGTNPPGPSMASRAQTRLLWPSTTEATSTQELQRPRYVANSSRLSFRLARQTCSSAAAMMESFGADLYGVLADKRGRDNLVFSPASIVTALAMTYAGAAGTTAEEMEAALHFSLPEEALHQAFNSLDALLESRSWEGKDHEGKDVGVLVRSANSLWGQQDMAFKQPFLDTLAANYGAGIRLVDYKTAAETARQAINDWVSAETAEKIPELIPQGTLDASHPAGARERHLPRRHLGISVQSGSHPGGPLHHPGRRRSDYAHDATVVLLPLWHR